MFDELKEVNYLKKKKKAGSGVLQCTFDVFSQITQNPIMQNSVYKYSAYKAK